MSKLEKVESVIPEFIDATVEEKADGEFDVIEITVEDDGHTFKQQMSAEEQEGIPVELELANAFRSITEHAVRRNL